MKGTHMKQLKYILPLLLTILTLAIYNPVQTQATTNQYSISFFQDSFHSYVNDGPLGAIYPAINRHRTNKIEIINNTIIINDTSLITTIWFWNNNTVIGYSQVDEPDLTDGLGNVSNNITPPTNATHFAIQKVNFGKAANITFAQFQTVEIFYNTPAPAYTPPTGTSLVQYTGVNDPYTYGTNSFDANGQYINSHPVFNSTNSLIKLYGDNWYTDEPEKFSQVWYMTNEGTFISSTTDINNVNPIPNNTSYMRTVKLNEDISNDPPNIWLNLSNVYTITFLNDLATLTFSETYSIEAGTSLTTLVNFMSTNESYTQYFAREGYVFEGWTAPNVMPSQNITVYVVWEQLITYDVTFLDWNNASIGTVTVEQGETAVPPYIPTRTGYTFDSWLPPVANVQGDITTVAQYTANTYLVTWTSDNIEVKTGQAPHDSTILTHAPAITKENHTLTGWAIDPTQTLVTSGQLITAPLSLTAVWEAVPTFTVTWRDVDFSTLKIEYVIQSGLATAPVYVAGSGLELVGWTPDPTQPITANTTFIAVVEQIPITPPIGTVNATGLTDLFAGVFGAIVGSIMILGTIDLYGIQLASLFWLFFAGTGFFLMWKFLVR
jgi:hypothetical protein